ncbi:GDSL esterase/lipase At5g03610-like isoform X1 [Bidens hawaiensis]|uniref:GDSL esterase/lipase At5g03610-like isoform X1 n=1 Tax=Bidens hawaiensis TaxID=980011 RepID=UPI00404B893E
MELHGVLSYTFFIIFLFFKPCAGESVRANEHDRLIKKPNHHHHHHIYRGVRPSKLFVFGDSYSDTGNNPKSLTNSWKPPYGATFPGKPTGRFSDGRVLTDYLARFMGIKSPLPYKVRKYAPGKLRRGLNFAYGGTGVFNTGNLLPNMTTQIGFLQKLIKNKVYTKRDLRSSLALVMVSGNDYNAYTSAGGTTQGLPAFITRVVDQMAIDLKLIHDTGIRRVLVATIEPIGCLPKETVFSSYQQCNGTVNLLSNFHNQLLQQAVTTLNNKTKDSSFIILDTFSAFNTVLNSKTVFTGSSKFGTPLKPCCVATRSDAYCGSVDENGKKLYTVCKEPESVFFWDTVHPTQAGWRAVYLTLRSSLNRIYY